MGQFDQIFKEESMEMLEELETTLLSLEKSSEDSSLIGKVFRALHTIKGSGAMFGFEKVSGFTHELENAFDLVRNGKLPVTSELIDITLKSSDLIRRALDDESCIDDCGEELLQRLKSVTEEEEEKGEVVGEEEPPQTDSKESTYRIKFMPDPDIPVEDLNFFPVFENLMKMGRCSILARTENLPLFDTIDPGKCYCGWDIIVTTSADEAALEDEFIFAGGNSSVIIEEVGGVGFDAEEDTKIGNILIDRGEVNQDKIDEVLEDRKKLGELLVEKGAVTRDSVEASLVEQQVLRDKDTVVTEKKGATSLRVSSEKVDNIVNLVGELVTFQARLSQMSINIGDSDLLTLAEEAERIIWELRDNSINMRMIPIGSTFSRFKRLVRDLSGALGKEVNLKISGGETELDKALIEKLNDPLIHIIRNSIDHGIEIPSRRVAAGKKPVGEVSLEAFHSGSSVAVRIKDDGNGMIASDIRKKAIEKGIIDENEVLSEKEIFNLIFEPGFSTAEKVSEVSGRGVGMDVVKRNIELLRGSIDVESEAGKGTTITLYIPLTLAIIEGLLVKIGGGFFVIPLAEVKECVGVRHEEICKDLRKRYISLRGEVIPYIYLRDELKAEGELPQYEQIVITGVGENVVGFVVDDVIGGHQTVIKSLGKGV